MADFRYVPELNGLRGLAILTVMIYHFMNLSVSLHTSFDIAVNNFFMMGWVGVDIFFALSGFLITSILLKTKHSATYYSSFYIKRILRIFPLYYLYLAFIFFAFFPIVYHHLNPAEQQSFKVAEPSQIYFWLYLSNIKQFFQHIFFGAGLGHIWSLSIEEQFYLVWPFLVYYLHLKNLKKMLIVVMLLSIVIRAACYFSNVPGLSIYTFTFTRLDALAYGAFIAAIVQQPVKIIYSRVKIAFKSLLIINILLFAIFGPWPNSTPVMLIIGFSLIGIMNALLILILQSEEPSRLKLFFNNGFLKFWGKYSYALYLFNPIVKQICFKILPPPFLIWGTLLLWDICFIIFCTLITIILALISWNCYEKWFMRIKAKYEKKQHLYLLYENAEL